MRGNSEGGRGGHSEEDFTSLICSLLSSVILVQVPFAFHIRSRLSRSLLVSLCLEHALHLEPASAHTLTHTSSSIRTITGTHLSRQAAQCSAYRRLCGRFSPFRVIHLPPPQISRKTERESTTTQLKLENVMLFQLCSSLNYHTIHKTYSNNQTLHCTVSQSSFSQSRAMRSRGTGLLVGFSKF